MYKHLLLTVLPILFSAILTAHEITGTVTDKNGNPLPGANLFWIKNFAGVVADSNGAFTINHNGDETGDLLAASYVGYKTDTINVSGKKRINFRLTLSAEMDEVEISDKRAGIVVSNRDKIKTEQITQTELEKAACCDLAGCFETQTTVQPQTTDVLSEAKELRIAGLSGVYNQILFDGLPAVQGLTYTYGLSSMPGTLIDNIYVSKGANSVLQGYESISGQINVEPKDPDTGEKLLLNAYGNNFGESQYNANVSTVGEKWSNLTSAHVTQPARVTDNQGDGFMDLPRITRYMLLNKTKYRDEEDLGFHTEFNVRYLNSNRIGGQTDFNPETDKGSTDRYGRTAQINQPEVWSKSGYRYNEKHHTDFYASAFQHRRNSYFGALHYDALQTNAYFRLQHEYRYGSGNDIKFGTSYRYLNLEEDITINEDRTGRNYGGNYLRQDRIPGIYAENTLSMLEGNLIWTAGLRSDHHQIHGNRITPRTFVKYDLSPKTTIRANAGTGWRMTNLFSEQIGLLASSRNIIFTEELKPEEAVNYGINITRKFDREQFSGYVSFDYYETRFQNQIFPDFDADPREAIIYNHTGKSVSRSYQAEFLLNFLERFEVKTGYIFLDVHREVEGEKRLLPFNPRHKVVSAFSYEPLHEKFHLDFNWHLFGRKRLPDTRSNPEQYQRPDFSPVFSLLNAQFTYNFGKFEVYAGCENIFNYRQRFPILGWQDPFGEHFDTSFIWGPVRGREMYAGLRFRLE